MCKYTVQSLILTIASETLCGLLIIQDDRGPANSPQLASLSSFVPPQTVGFPHNSVYNSIPTTFHSYYLTWLHFFLKSIRKVCIIS